MARSTFFSFHYQRDVFRVNQIRNAPNIVGSAAAGFSDASIWENAKKTSDAAIEELIDNGLLGTSVTVVCIGARTEGRKFINYEIQRSIDRNNGILGLHIHGIWAPGGTDVKGDVPYKLTAGGYNVRTYTNLDDLSRWIEAAAKAAGR